MSLTDMVKQALAKVEPAVVTRKRQREEDEMNMSLDDLPLFAQKALVSMQEDINRLESAVQKQKVETDRLKGLVLSQSKNISRLHETIVVLGAQRISGGGIFCPL